jgi:hypothetical protein
VNANTTQLPQPRPTSAPACNCRYPHMAVAVLLPTASAVFAQDSADALPLLRAVAASFPSNHVEGHISWEGLERATVHIKTVVRTL